jgi:hypothetical protein
MKHAVLLPAGWPSCRYEALPLHEAALSRKWRVIAVDRYGVGKSSFNPQGELWPRQSMQQRAVRNVRSQKHVHVRRSQLRKISSSTCGDNSGQACDTRDTTLRWFTSHVTACIALPASQPPVHRQHRPGQQQQVCSCNNGCQGSTHRSPSSTRQHTSCFSVLSHHPYSADHWLPHR